MRSDALPTLGDLWQAGSQSFQVDEGSKQSRDLNVGLLTEHGNKGLKGWEAVGTVARLGWGEWRGGWGGVKGSDG